MMKMLMSFLAMISMVTLPTNAPILFILLIIMTALMVSLLLKNLMITSWMAMILFLIFIGGLMILFTYITSLASNNFLPLTKSLLAKHAIIFTMFFMALVSPLMQEEFKPSMTSLTCTMFKMYSESASLTISLAIMYLLFTLVTISYITTSKSAPLRTNLKPNF